MPTNNYKKYKNINKTKINSKNKKNRKNNSKKMMKGGSICNLFENITNSRLPPRQSSELPLRLPPRPPTRLTPRLPPRKSSELQPRPNTNIVIPKFHFLPTGSDFDTNKEENVVNFVIEHQKNRFKELEYILDNTTDVKVIIAGNPKTGNHALGTGFAKDQWKKWGDNNTNRPNHTKMIDNLDILVKSIMKKYKDRVSLGAIGLSTKTTNRGQNFCNEDPKLNPSSKIIHVWGANENNWNRPTDKIISGGGQVECLDTQMPGIFGIATTVHNAKPNSIPNSIDNLFKDTTNKIKKYL